MSYCVNCGVKLEQSLETCPLCHTPVINPNSIKSATPTPSNSPFAEMRGEVEPVNKKDIFSWLTIVFASIAVGCLLLNLTLYKGSPWSIPVIGTCILMWVFFCPRMYDNRIPLSVSLIVDVICIALYSYFLTFLTENDLWFFELAVPITIMLSILLLIFFFLYACVSRNLLATVLYFFIEAGFFSIALERFIDQFLGLPLQIGWSAVVFYLCLLISIGLASVLSIRRLRQNAKKIFHI